MAKVVAKNQQETPKKKVAAKSKRVGTEDKVKLARRVERLIVRMGVDTINFDRLLDNVINSGIQFRGLVD